MRKKAKNTDKTNNFEFHEITEQHASELLTKQKKVYGMIENNLVEITAIEQAQKYYID